MKRGYRYICFILFLFILQLDSGRVSAQAGRDVELSAQEIVARVDRALDYPKGMFKGRMVHLMPNGRMSRADITGYTSDSDYLFTFSTPERGDQMKVLYNFRGEDIWVYNILSIKLFHKMGIDKFDSILFTNFSYIDFSNADLQSNYTAKIIGDAFVREYDSYKLKLMPLYKGGSYGMLTLYVSKKDYIPLRIDYHDNDMVIFKTMTMADTRKISGRSLPTRYDMLDIRKGTITILNLFGFDPTLVFDKKIFMHQSLGAN